VRQALRNIVEVLAEADARPESIVRMTWHVMTAGQFPCSSRIARVEIESLAVVL